MLYLASILSHNVKHHVKQDRDEVAQQFMKVTQIYSEAEFEQQYQEFREMYPSCATYLDKSVDVKNRAKCHFPGARYNKDTSDCADSLNALFEYARKLYLVPMIDVVVDTHTKDAAVGPSAQKLVLFVENKMHKRVLKGEKLRVTLLNTFELEYSAIGKDGKTNIVDFHQKKCSCRKFDIYSYPCVHAIGAAVKCLKHDRPLELSDMYDIISPYYLIKVWALAYRMTIYLVPHMSEWMVPKDIAEQCPSPPKYTKKGKN